MEKEAKNLKGEVSISKSRDAFRALLHNIHTQARILTNSLIKIEKLFCETNASKSEIDFLSVEEFFDKQANSIKNDMKKVVNKFIDDKLIKKLSKSCSKSKSYKKSAEKIIKDIRKKYKDMTENFFIPKEKLEKDLYEQTLQLLGENERLGVLEQASYLSSIHPSIKGGQSLFSDRDEDLMKMKRELEEFKIEEESQESSHNEFEGFMDRSNMPQGEIDKTPALRIKPSNTADNFRDNDSGEYDDEVLETQSLRGSNYSHYSSVSIKINEKPHLKQEIDFSGLPRSINIKRKNMKIEKFESGIETGNLQYKLTFKNSCVHLPERPEDRLHHDREASPAIRIHPQGNQRVVQRN